MALPSDAIDVVDLRALADGGTVLEDVYRSVFFLQTVADTPFTNLIGTAPCNSDKTEWVFDDYDAAGAGNVRVAGSDPSTWRTPGGTRVSNRAQINSESFVVSSTAQASQIAGDVAPLAYETNKALVALRQAVEYNAVSNQAGVIGDNNTTAQKAGGYSAWLTTNTSVGATGSDGGYNSTTHIVDAPSAGTGRALSWAYVTAQLLNVFNARGDVRYLMSVPQLIQGINQKIVDGTIKVATPTANVSGTSQAEQVGQGWFTGVISDFGFMLTFVPNRSQPKYSTSCDVLLIDPQRVQMGYHEGYKVTDLGPTSGLSTKRDITVSWTVMPRREDAHAVVRDILFGSAVTA